MGTQVHHKHLVILNSSLARWRSIQLKSTWFIWFTLKKELCWCKWTGLPSLQLAFITWLTGCHCGFNLLLVHLLFLWFLSFLCFLPFPNLSFQAPTSLNKVPLCGLAITKSYKLLLIIYLFIWYLFHSNNWTRSRHGKNKCSAWPRVFALRMEYSLWTAIKYRKCFFHNWTPSLRRWCSWSLQMSLHFLMRWSRMLTSYLRYVCLWSYVVL